MKQKKPESVVPLKLDPRSRIVLGKDALHVVNARGAFDLKGKNLHLLHQRLARPLQAGIGEGELLAAVGPQGDVVRGYLAQLRSVGALVDGPEPRRTLDLRAADDLGEGLPRALLEVSGTRVTVALDGGADPGAAPLALSFLEQPELERRLLAGPRRAGREVWVQVPAPPTREDLTGRAAIARFLLALILGRGRPRAGELDIFELREPGQELLLRGKVRAGEIPWKSLPRQLGLVELADRPQLPLVHLRARLPGLASEIQGVGQDERIVRSRLGTQLLGRAALDLRKPGTESLTVRRLEAPYRRPGEELSWPLAAEMLIRPSRAQLVDALLLRAAVGGDPSGGETVDLLEVPTKSAEVRALQGALADRKSLDGILDLRDAPLVRIHRETTSIAGWGRDAALAEALLQAATEGMGSPPPLGLRRLPSPSACRRRREALADRVGRIPLLVGRLPVCGRSVALGTLLEAEG